MAYYVPLGPRGLILRLGTAVLGVFGGLIYWRASRRRAPRADPGPRADRRSGPTDGS